MREGFLLIDKPQDWTSHDCVAILRRFLKVSKIGHTGTLDPMATGLLLVAVGRATRMIEYTDVLNKTYVGRMRLGCETTTDDIWGEVTEQTEVGDDFLERLRKNLPQFIGEQDQKPPLYSAVRVDGRRLYSYARKGEAVNIKPRQVFIKSIEILGVHEADDIKEVELKVECGTGTYIRSLFRDLGRAIGTRATMSSLRRTAIGGFSVDNDKVVSMLEVKKAYGEFVENDFLWDSLLLIDALIKHLPSVDISGERSRSFLLGAQVKVFEKEVQMPLEKDVALDRKAIRVYSDRTFLGIAEQQGNMLVPKKVVIPDLKGNCND